MNQPLFRLALLMSLLALLNSCKSTCCSLRKTEKSRTAVAEQTSKEIQQSGRFIKIRSKPESIPKELPPFEVWSFAKAGETKPDRTKPPLILLHEALGLSPENLVFGNHLSDHFTVYMPVFFGASPEKGVSRTQSWMVKSFLPLPTRSFLRNEKSFNAIISWLGEFSNELSQIHHGKKVGIIGQCATGAMPLYAMQFPQVGAGVICQPTYPARLLFNKEDMHRLNLEPSRAAALKAAVIDKNAKLMGVRFENDPYSPPQAFTHLKCLFRDRFIAHQINQNVYKAATGDDRPDIPKLSHSVFAEAVWSKPTHPTMTAYNDVVSYLKASLE